MVLKKPQPKFQKRYTNRKQPEIPEPDFTVAENEQAARAASSTASQDLSAQEGDNLNDGEALRRYRNSLANTILPITPDIPGFHVCWIPMTSNNHSDTVDARKHLGYELVREDEVPGYISPSNRGGAYDGCVTHNELVLMKLPMRLYNLYMKDAHHIQPNRQEESILSDISGKLRDDEGASIQRDTAEMTGMRRLARKVREPNFS